MKMNLILSVTLLLIASGISAGAAGAGPIPPSITVSDAVGTSPGTVYTAGQPQHTVNVAWNAGSDYPYCEIYYTVNNANQTELGRGHDGAKPLTVKAGSTYALWMVVYLGAQGQDVRTVAEFTVVGNQGNPPSPSSSPGGGGLGGVVSGPIGKNKDPGARYLLAINNVRVEPGAHHMMIRFNGPPNQVPYVAIGRAAPVMRDGEWVFQTNLVGGGFVATTVSAAEKAKGQYTFASAFGTTFSNEGLEPGGTYYYIITIPAGAGRRSYQDTDKFTMLREATTVRVVWEKVKVEDDSDDLSTGEIEFWFWANYGLPSGKFSEYYNGDADSGHSYGINQTVTMENAPNTLTLAASGRDSDCEDRKVSANAPPLNRPQSYQCNDENVAKDSFDLTKYDDNATVNFILNTMSGGALKFVIFGRFEITRTTLAAGSSGNSENTGTTGSALTSTPATPEPVKAIGRVKLPPTGAPPRPICDVAREARARNSPAAPGLEAQCRADLAGRGAAIAEADPIVAAARTVETDVLYRQGFDIATGIFGDPALGALGNTATGPGSLKIRDSLSAAGQRGFNAAVKLHLSRNYKP